MSDQIQQSVGTQQSTTQKSQGSNNAANQPFNPWEESAGGGGDEQNQGAENEQQQSSQTKVGQNADGAGTQEGQRQNTKATGGAAPEGSGTVQGLTPEAISKLVAETVGATVKANQPAAATPQFTEADFIDTFKVFQPTPELLAEIGLPATPAGAQIFRDKFVTPIVRQAVTMAAFQMQKLQQDLEAKFEKRFATYEPARQLAASQQEATLRDEFLTKHEDLKGYEPLLQEIYARLQSQGTRFKDKDEAFKTIAEQARGLIKSIPGLQNPQGQVTQPQPNNTTNGASRMSGLSGSGQGGVRGASGGSTKKKNTSEQLWG